MRAIIFGWKQAFSFLRPSNLAAITMLALRQFWRALRIFLKHSWWMVALDASIFFASGPAISKTLAAYTKDTAVTVNPIIGLTMLVNSVLTFLISSIIFILIRRRTTMPFKVYIRANLIKYIQLMLIFSIIFLLFIYLIISFGIKTIPQMPLLLLITTKVVQDITAFFWLDMPYQLKNIFVSFEKAINLIFYHLPFVSFLILLWLGFDYGINLATRYFFDAEPGKLMVDATNLFAGIEKPTTQFIALVLGIKYAMLLINNVWISLLFAFYHKTKREVFSESFFNK